MTALQKTNRILLLWVLVLCLGIKVHAAYTKVVKKPVLQKVEATYKPPVLKIPTRNQAPSSNILFVWRKKDGTSGSHSFSQEEFYKVSLLAINMPEAEFKAIMEEGKVLSKESLLLAVNNNINMLQKRTKYAYSMQAKIK